MTRRTIHRSRRSTIIISIACPISCRGRDAPPPPGSNPDWRCSPTEGRQPAALDSLAQASRRLGQEVHPSHVSAAKSPPPQQMPLGTWQFFAVDVPHTRTRKTRSKVPALDRFYIPIDELTHVDRLVPSSTGHSERILAPSSVRPRMLRTISDRRETPVLSASAPGAVELRTLETRTRSIGIVKEGLNHRWISGTHTQTHGCFALR